MKSARVDIDRDVDQFDALIFDELCQSQILALDFAMTGVFAIEVELLNRNRLGVRMPY